MCNLRPFYAVLAVLICCITTSGEVIPKTIPIIGTTTYYGNEGKINVYGNVIPASHGKRDLLIKVTATRKLLQDLTRVVALQIFLQVHCRTPTLYECRSFDENKVKNEKYKGKDYKLDEKSLVLDRTDPSRFSLNLRFYNADKYLGYGQTFALSGYDRNRKFVTRKVTINWYQETTIINGYILKQKTTKNAHCTMVSTQLIVPTVDKYKLLIKAFIGTSFGNRIEAIVSVDFKVKDKDKNGKDQWTLIGHNTLIFKFLVDMKQQPPTKKVQPDKRFPNLRFRVNLKNHINGYSTRKYDVVAEIVFSDFRQAIGHTFSITFLALLRMVSTYDFDFWTQHLEVKVDYKKQKTTPKPTTRPPTTRRPRTRPPTTRRPSPTRPGQKTTPKPKTRRPNPTQPAINPTQRTSKPGETRINPTDDEDDEADDYDEGEKKVNDKNKGEGDNTMVMGGVIGVLLIVLIIVGLYGMKSSSPDEKQRSPDKNHRRR